MNKIEGLQDLSLAECLNYIQVNLNAPKNLHNKFGNYKYRNLEGIYEGLKPLLDQTQCIVTITDTIEMVGDRYYIKATATIIKNEETISVDGWARESLDKKGMDTSQITGSTSSYARKYAMNGLFAIDDVADADSMDNRYTITEEQKVRYKELLISKFYHGKRRQTYKWFKEMTTKEQAESALNHMLNAVNKFNEKNQKKELVNEQG